MGHNFIQIPPDSTGKKIRHIQRVDSELTNILIDFNLIEKGATVVGLTSGVTGNFTGVTSNFGEIYLHVENNGNVFTVGESITINGSPVGEIINSTVQYTPNVVVVDADSPHHTQKIDSNGSVYTRYSEGDLGFDAFGYAQFSQTSQIDSHVFTYGDSPEKYWDVIIGSSYITSSIVDSSLVMFIDSISGSKASRTSHQYYPYNPGEGNTLQTSLRTGDEGKAGVVRRWGLYDDLDGIFFELDETIFKVGIRSSTSGVAVDTKVPRAEFNGDSLDDVNVSEYILEFSKYNLYWIDFQWLGVGKVRMGTFSPNGKRVTIHTFKNPNAHTVPYMKRGTLPFKMEIFNKSGSASSSEMRSVCTTIGRQSQIVNFPGEYETFISPVRSITEATPKVLFSAKPMVTYNGVVNRTTIIPTDLEVNISGSPVRIDIIKNGYISGSTYVANDDADSTVLIDNIGTTITGGTRIESIMCPAGVSHRELEEKLYNSLKLSADGVSQPILSFVANIMATTGSADVNMIMRWKEAR